MLFSGASAQITTRADSLKAQYDVLRALRQLESRVSSIQNPLRRFTPVRRGEAYGICELPVADYCYGPKNGKMFFGGYGTISAANRLATGRVDRSDQTLLKRELEFYLVALK